jgi:predicted CopG family antitoxin
MSTKNIALNTRVYELLARYKADSESFSKTVERLLSQAKSQHTGGDVLRHLDVPPLTQEEAEAMLNVIEENRGAESWQRHDLR